jgi:hypothetical protein
MISLILIVLAGMCNALYEIIFVFFNQSIFKNLNPLFWDPKMSWKNKWAQPYPQPVEPKWYYFGFLPRYKERFIHSSTMFVGLTDAWHLFKSIMLGCIMAAIVLYTPIINPFVDFLLLYFVFTFTFTIFYEYIFRTNKTV